MSNIPDNPLRRRLLAGATAALTAGAAAVTTAWGFPGASPEAAGDDAKVLRLAREFWVHDAVMDDWNAHRVSWEVGEPAQDRWWECLEEMAALRATTPEGVGTKARCMLHALEGEESSGKAEDCVREFLADLAGRAAV